MITGKDAIETLNYFRRKGADSTKLAELYGLFNANGNGENITDEDRQRIVQILTGTFKDEQNLADLVRDWVEGANGTFLSSDVFKSLQLSSRNDHKNLSQILKRMSQEDKPLIEKYGNKNGQYRRVVFSERRMNLNNVDMTEINIKLPLALHKKTILFKKAIVVVAGVTGTGKTTFALNFIKENMYDHNIYYMNQEMHEQALRFKLTHFPDMKLEDWKFTPLTDIDDYGPSIRPGDINVIDYLEAPQGEFWRIGDLIRGIERKLKDGMALIFIQRKSNALWGEGAEFSARASSLYVNMSWGSVEVMKNRYREGDQFKGCEKRDFEVKQGVIKPKGGWYQSGTGKPQRNVDNDFPKESDLEVEDI